MAHRLILIVEDSHYLARAIAEVVQDMGFATQIAATGEEALEAVSKEAPDLILLDWLLPGISGLEVLTQIREGGHSELPIIMLTAKNEVASRVKGLEAGADDYIAKPVHMNELQARISTVLRRAD